MLARAFKEDPVFVSAVPDLSQRIERTKYIFQTAVCLGLRYGEVRAIPPNLEGVAVWIPYEHFKETPWGNILCAFKSRIWKMGLKYSRAFQPLLEFNNKKHYQFALGKHWYLQTLGVNPQYQGKGYGSMLVQTMLEFIDKDPLPVYLEIFTERNVKFYSKFGFEVLEQATIPGTDVLEYFLLREIK